MNNRIKILIGAISLLLVAAVAVVALLPENNFVKDIFVGKPTYQPTTTTTRTPNPTTVAYPTSKPTDGTVTLPTQMDPDTGDSVISFPCTVEPFGLVVEKLGSYTGEFVEDPAFYRNEAVTVAAIRVHNQSGHPIERAVLTVACGDATLLFEIAGLPAGARAVVQDRYMQPMPNADPTACQVQVIQRAEMEFSENQVAVTENEDGSLTVTNLTDAIIPSIRLFYKFYDAEEDMYLGGIAFTANITDLRPQSSTTIRPSHYAKGYSRVVRVATYGEGTE